MLCDLVKSETNSFAFLVPLEQVLHMDRNDYYGGESTSLHLNQVVLIYGIGHCQHFFCVNTGLTCFHMWLIALEAIQGQ